MVRQVAWAAIKPTAQPLVIQAGCTIVVLAITAWTIIMVNISTGKTLIPLFVWLPKKFKKVQYKLKVDRLNIQLLDPGDQV